MFDLISYIDPGTGAMALQVVVATLLGVGFVFRRLFVSPFAAVFGQFRKRKHGVDRVASDE